MAYQLNDLRAQIVNCNPAIVKLAQQIANVAQQFSDLKAQIVNCNPAIVKLAQLFGNFTLQLSAWVGNRNSQSLKFQKSALPAHGSRLRIVCKAFPNGESLHQNHLVSLSGNRPIARRHREIRRKQAQGDRS